jgi:hypothetical protein
MFYFCLIEEGEEKEEKKRKKEKIALGEEDFPGAGHSFLAVPWVTAVRCN